MAMSGESGNSGQPTGFNLHPNNASLKFHFLPDDNPLEQNSTGYCRYWNTGSYL
jgi:hypothetical protein